MFPNELLPKSLSSFFLSRNSIEFDDSVTLFANDFDPKFEELFPEVPPPSSNDELPPKEESPTPNESEFIFVYF